MEKSVPIESEYVHSGDMIDIEYQVVGTNETMIARFSRSRRGSLWTWTTRSQQPGRRIKL